MNENFHVFGLDQLGRFRRTNIEGMQLGAGVNIFTPPGREVVDYEDPVPGLNDGVGNMRADKAGSTCDEYGSSSLGDIEILSES